jgi:hypothetical protein
MNVGDVHVAIDSAGDVAVAWQDTMSPSTFVANVSTRRSGGSFGTPDAVSNGDNPRVGIDAAGNVTFLYDIVNSGASNGEFVRETPAGSSVLGASPHTLSSTCSGFGADVAVAPSGDAIVGFGCGDVAFALRRAGVWGTTATPFSGSFTPCPTIVLNTSFTGVRVAIDGQGHPVGVVERTDSQNDCMGGSFNTRMDSIVLAMPAGGVMVAGPTVAVSGTGVGFGGVPNDVGAATVGIGGGSVVVGWRGADDTGFRFQPATRTYTGNGVDPPGAVQPIGDPRASADGPQVSVGPTGQTLLSWTAAAPGAKSVSFVAFRPSGGAFGQPLPASDGTGDAASLSSGIADSGDGIVGWVQAQGTAHAAHARGFDVTPPTLSGVSMPPSATVGSPTPFAAQAFDVWGPVSLTWNFGDGATVGGNTSHAFLAAGPHVVTITAMDSAGNATSQNGTVLVTGLPGGGAISRPALTKVSETNSVFRVGVRPTAIASAKKGRAPIGTTFRFSLDRPADVTIAFSRSTVGRRSGGRCVKLTKRLAHAKPCTRVVKAGVLTRHGNPGINSVAFTGRLGRAPLQPGGYRATFIARAGNMSSLPSNLRFRVVR